MSAKKSESQGDRLGRLQGEVFVIWKQVEAFGFLLERQGCECEGVVELHGLGLALIECGRARSACFGANTATSVEAAFTQPVESSKTRTDAHYHKTSIGLA